MLGFLSNFELTIAWLFLAVPTGIAFVRYRRRNRGSDIKMGGCLPLALAATAFGAALIILSAVDMWRRTQPDKMLSRFLKVDDHTEFSDLRSHFSKFGFEYTAWIYFQTSEKRLIQLVTDLKFERLPDGKPNQGLDFAGFHGAPEIPSQDEAVVYYRMSPENHDVQYVVTNHQHNRAWFVSLDY
jgi:hypothetical protein